MFTGDRSGNWVFRGLFKSVVASRASSTHLRDGLSLLGVGLAPPCHCAPPDNKPLPSEIANCSQYLTRLLHEREWSSVLCLGGIAWNHVFNLLGTKRQAFGHGATFQVPAGPLLVASYHPSQQNTFTGRL